MRAAGGRASTTDCGDVGAVLRLDDFLPCALIHVAAFSITDETLLTEKSVVDARRVRAARRCGRRNIDGVVIGGGDRQGQIVCDGDARLLPQTVIGLAAGGPRAEPTAKAGLQAVPRPGRIVIAGGIAHGRFLRVASMRDGIR